MALRLRPRKHLVVEGALARILPSVRVAATLAAAGAATRTGRLLRKENRHFGGTYEGDEKGATAADSTVPSAARFSNAAYVEAGKAHEVLVIVTARGLSAGVSKGKITLTPEW